MNLLFILQTTSSVQINKALRALINDHTDESIDFEPEEKVNSSEKIDALEVTNY